LTAGGRCILAARSIRRDAAVGCAAIVRRYRAGYRGGGEAPGRYALILSNGIYSRERSSRDNWDKLVPRTTKWQRLGQYASRRRRIYYTRRCDHANRTRSIEACNHTGEATIERIDGCRCGANARHTCFGQCRLRTRGQENRAERYSADGRQGPKAQKAVPARSRWTHVTQLPRRKNTQLKKFSRSNALGSCSCL
jgi:hypothetical protein